MNNARRTQIAEALSAVEDARAKVEALRDEEQEYYDNMPESLQGGEKGQLAESAIDSLGNAVNALEEAESALGEASS